MLKVSERKNHSMLGIGYCFTYNSTKIFYIDKLYMQLNISHKINIIVLDVLWLGKYFPKFTNSILFPLHVRIQLVFI